MNNPLVVCALRDEFSIKGSNYDLLYTGVGKVNAAIHLTEYLVKKGIPEFTENFLQNSRIFNVIIIFKFIV